MTLSDSGGFVHDPDGIDAEKLAWVMELKNVRARPDQRVRGAIPRGDASVPGRRPGREPALGASRADCAFPSATQNEISGKDAVNLLGERGRARGRGRQHADHARRLWSSS